MSGPTWDRIVDAAQVISLDGEFDVKMPDDVEPGLACVCGATWCRVGGLRRLADVTCPSCGAGYADVGRNVEP